MLGFTTRHNAFPFQYHNDEPSKTDQIYEGRRNFLHPPLMLDITAIVSGATGAGGSRQNIALTGRWLSAIYATITVIAFSAWIGLVAGRAAMFLAGYIFLLDPRLYEIAHYFKEDTLFLAGIALALLSGSWCARKQSRCTALACGAALGVLAGSKYIGFPIALLLGVLTTYRLREHRAVLKFLGAGFLAALVAVYWSLIWQAPSAVVSIQEELAHLRYGHYGVGASVPHNHYVRFLFLAYPSLLLWGACGAAVYYAWKRRGTHPDFLGFLILSILTVGVLSFLPKTSERYLLPVYLAMTGALAVCCGWMLQENRGTNLHKLVGLLLVLLFSIYTIPKRLEMQAGFGSDSRADLMDFIQQTIPPQTPFAIDAMVNPHESVVYAGRPGEFSYPVHESYFAADLGTVEDLRAEGIEYFVGSWDVHHRYRETRLTSSDPVNVARSDFYNRLYDEGEILWHVSGQHPKPLHPGLVLIRLPQARD